VVVTVSSSYLQRHYMSLFNPSLLSEQKILAINSIKMDTVDKIFLFYDDLSFFPPHVTTTPLPLTRKTGPLICLFQPG